MAEKPEKAAKPDKAAKADKAEKPVKAEKPEKKDKKDKKDKVAADVEAPVAAAPVEKKNTPPRPRIPQLAKKNKSRLPRRQKKALQKAAKK